MLLLATPIVIWTVTGSYFVLMDIGFIRSDHVSAQAASIDLQQLRYPINQLYQDYPLAQQVLLKPLLNKAVYQLTLADKKVLLDASSGERLGLITAQQARQIAVLHQVSIPATSLISLSYIEANAPEELASRHLPVWRADFDDVGASSLYISAQTGEVVTYRHNYWRLFDLFWKWHIMDYDHGEAIDNPLLFYTAIGSFIATFSGLILVWQRRKRYVK